jgi:hypothetical protein
LSATADLTALLSNAEMRREETHKDEWLDYYMAIKNRALEVIEDLEQTQQPTFSGKVEDWPEFRSVWMELLAEHPESVQVQYLRKSIPANDARHIAGVKTMGEAWRRLEDVYGNLQLNIITVKTNLESFMPKAVERYKKIREVYEAVEKAVTQLSNLGALHYLKEDFSLMNRIVLKLAEEEQTQYHEYITSDDVMTDVSSTWDMFWGWMEKIHI